MTDIKTATELTEIEQRAYKIAAKTARPALVGIAAWGFVVGVAMIKAKLTLAQALGMSLLVFAGSAQLAALPLMLLGTPIWVIFVTSLVINLRFVITSAIVSKHFMYLTQIQRAFWSFITMDVTTAYFIGRYPDAPTNEELTPAERAARFGYLKGLCVPIWFGWQAGSISGIFIGNAIPEQWGVGFAGTLAILCILLPMTQNRAMLVGVAVTCVIAMLTLDWPYKLGMLSSVVVGMMCGMLFSAWTEKQTAQSV